MSQILHDSDSPFSELNSVKRVDIRISTGSFAGTLMHCFEEFSEQYKDYRVIIAMDGAPRHPSGSSDESDNYRLGQNKNIVKSVAGFHRAIINF
jgi:hypothetical protein